MLGLVSCGSRQFTQGEYDDVNEVRHLDDEFNEDAKSLSEEMIKSLQAHPTIVGVKIPCCAKWKTCATKHPNISTQKY